MGYASLSACVADLEKCGQLRRVDYPVDPFLELAHIQRRAFQSKAPALLFTNVKGCRFPMLANLFGTKERVNFIFRDSLESLKTIFEAKADFAGLLRQPGRLLRAAPLLARFRPKRVSPENAPVLAEACVKADLPKLISWPMDGGPFITLPLVYSEDPQSGRPNLGMYRVQLSGNEYDENEAGMHYQLQRGIGIHHAAALARGEELPVNIHVGGPPALVVAAIMPLPEGMSELSFAGLLGARRVRVTKEKALPVLADADFVLRCRLGNKTKPEGPFGDHLGYYSLKHEFPVVKIDSVQNRKDAIWPFTSVGRPPQEDTVFGDLIHELTAPLVSGVFEGVKQVRAVDAAGVHPLLLAIGSERYTAWESVRKPRELLTLAMHLLGTTQTALAKYVLIAAEEDAPGLDCRDIPAFLRHILERTDFGRDLHFFSQCACDTLDYSGYNLHEGSRLVWACAGPKRRELAGEIDDPPSLPTGFANLEVVMPGIAVLAGPKHDLGRMEQDEKLLELCRCLENWRQRENFPLIVAVDEPDFCAASLENFLWTTFTRSDPGRDIYGAHSVTKVKHWGCQTPLVIDARLKSFQAAPLLDDPEVVRRVENLSARGKPLAGIF